MEDKKRMLLEALIEEHKKRMILEEHEKKMIEIEKNHEKIMKEIYENHEKNMEGYVIRIQTLLQGIPKRKIYFGKVKTE